MFNCPLKPSRFTHCWNGLLHSSHRQVVRTFRAYFHQTFDAIRSKRKSIHPSHDSSPWFPLNPVAISIRNRMVARRHKSTLDYKLPANRWQCDCTDADDGTIRKKVLNIKRKRVKNQCHNSRDQIDLAAKRSVQLRTKSVIVGKYCHPKRDFGQWFGFLPINAVENRNNVVARPTAGEERERTSEKKRRKFICNKKIITSWTTQGRVDLVRKQKMNSITYSFAMTFCLGRQIKNNRREITNKTRKFSQTKNSQQNIKN